MNSLTIPAMRLKNNGNNKVINAIVQQAEVACKHTTTTAYELLQDYANFNIVETSQLTKVNNRIGAHWKATGNSSV